MATDGRALAVAGAVAVAAAFLAGSGSAGRVQPEAAIRVDQLGFTPGETKVAYLLAASRPGAAGFTVVNRAGRVVLRGRAGGSRGPWNARYRFVAPLDLTSV